MVAATERSKRPLRGNKEIALAVGKVLGRYKMGKHFRLRIEEDHFSYERDQANIDREAALDGIYVIRTSLGVEASSNEETVRRYKNLAVVERAFRTLKSVDLKVRPIHHHLPGRVRAHVFVCLLAYYVEWHMRRALAPTLFDDENPEAAQQLRDTVVRPAQRSPKAQRKARTKRTDDGLPVHSFQTLLQDLQTITNNQVKMADQAFEMSTTPTALQQRAFDLLHVPCRR
jgi:transposase